MSGAANGGPDGPPFLRSDRRRGRNPLPQSVSPPIPQGRGLPLPSFRCRRTFFSYRRGGTLARPFPVFGAVPIDASPTLHPLPRLVGTRRGGETEQAEILHRIRVRWWLRWSREATAGHPRRRFGPFAAAGKETRPAGRNPQRRMKPIRKPAGGSETPPTASQADHSRRGPREGQAHPLRAGRTSVP